MEDNLLSLYAKQEQEVKEFTRKMTMPHEQFIAQYSLLEDETAILGLYNKEQVQSWLEAPQRFQEPLRQLHLYLLRQSFFYKRLLSHFCNMLTFDFVLAPIVEDSTKINKKTYLKEQEKAFNYLEKLNVKNTFQRIAKTVIGEGGGYYFCRDLGHTIDLQEIPPQFCTIVDKNELGYIYAINLSLFTGKEQLLNNYDKKIQDAYEYYITKNRQQPYYVFSNRIAPVFKFDDTTSVIIPTFIALFYDIFDMFDMKKMIKDKMLLDNWKLVFQKIPMNQEKGARPNQFLLPVSTAEEFHKAIKGKLPRGMDIITSPMDITPVNTERTDSENGMLYYPEKSFWESSGTSGLLFGADRSGSAGLNASIQVDENFVMPIYRQIEKWLNAKLRYVNNDIKFKVIFPNITTLNQKDKQADFLKMAQYGYPKELASSAMGITPMELHGLMLSEKMNSLVDKLVPLQSSHTASMKDAKINKTSNNETNSKGEELAPSTIINNDNETNKNKKAKL